jgi:hypothetical protein
MGVFTDVGVRLGSAIPTAPWTHLGPGATPAKMLLLPTGVIDRARPTATATALPAQSPGGNAKAAGRSAVYLSLVIGGTGGTAAKDWSRASRGRVRLALPLVSYCPRRRQG